MMPMLAGKAPAKVQFPVYVSPKLDGIRAICSEGKVLSRSLKPIPNRAIQAALSKAAVHGLDGELISGAPNAHNAMQASTSCVMTRDSTAYWNYHVFDLWHCPEAPFHKRWAQIKSIVPMLEDLGFPQIKLVPHHIVDSEKELLWNEAQYLEQGYEGIMIRQVNGPYKYGRSTTGEGYLLKLKRFEDHEAVIVDFDPKLHNANEQTRDERGYAKRSSHKENLVALDTLGALVVIDEKTKKKFKVGTGMDDQMRQHIWENRSKYLGATITYKSFPGGVKDLPRFPVFKAFRDRRDMSA